MSLPQVINPHERVVSTEPVHIQSATFLYRVASEPAHVAWIVETITVVVEIVFSIIVFRREAMAEQVNKRAGCGDEITEGIAGVLCNCVTVSV